MLESIEAEKLDFQGFPTETGAPRGNALCLALFDARRRDPRRDGLGLVAEAYCSLHPEEKDAETVPRILDGIWAIRGRVPPSAGRRRGPCRRPRPLAGMAADRIRTRGKG